MSSSSQQKQQQEAVLDIVLKQFLPYCNENAEHEVLRKMGVALENGGTLKGKSPYGGYTNYSYQLYFETDKGERLSVFAKVALSHALWSTDSQQLFHLDRITTEYELSRQISQTSNNVVKPYLLLDVPEHNMRIMIIEYSDTVNTTLGRPFISNDILLSNNNHDILTPLAQLLARINLTNFDSSLNKEWVDSFQPITQNLNGMLYGLLAEDRNDAATKYAKEVLGQDRIYQMNTAYDTVMSTCHNSLLHGDFHVNNVLIDNTNNSNNNDFLVVDWEMSRPGPLGYDVGTFLSFPIEIAFFLAAQGKIKEAKQMITVLQNFWKSYAQILKEEGNHDDESLQHVFKRVIAGCGWCMMIPMYCMGICRDDINKDGLTQTDIDHTVGVYGRSGLRCFEFGYMDDMDFDDKTLEELEEFLFKTVTCDEFEHLAAFTSPIPQAAVTSPRRASSGSACWRLSLESVSRRLSNNLQGVERRLSSASFGN